MERTEKYFECIFTDGTKEDFEHLCTTVEEFGVNKDMLVFKARNYTTNYFVTLQIIPKTQIRQVINHYAEGDLKEVFEDS